jgi:hypothetical protein
MSRYRELSSYPQEFFLAWDQAIEGRLAIAFPTRGKATNMKQQLNAFRRAFAKEGGDLLKSQAMYKVDLEVQLVADGSAVLTGGLAGWKKQIREAAGESTSIPPGIVGNKVSKIIMDEIEPSVAAPTPTPGHALDDTLKGLGFSTEEPK